MIKGEKIEIPEEAAKYSGLLDGSKISTMHAAQVCLQYMAQKTRSGKQDFVEINNCEMMPEICNEFVTIFIDQQKYKIDRGDAIDLTRNFCCWIRKYGLTCVRISMT